MKSLAKVGYVAEIEGGGRHGAKVTAWHGTEGGMVADYGGTYIHGI